MRKDKNGHDDYFFRGKKAYHNYAQNPGSAGFITKFDFSWDGKRIEIPRRFWEDLMTSLSADVKDVDQMSADELYEFEADQEDKKDSDSRPRLYLSSSDTEGTALIEWMRPLLQCDQSVIERWIISKKGTVVRHSFVAPCRGC